MPKTDQTSEVVVGSVITIVGDKCNKRFLGKQGWVVGIRDDEDEDGPYEVRFPAWYKYLFDYPNKPDTIVRFTLADMRVEVEQRLRTEKIPINDYVQYLFGHGMACWAYYVPELPLIPGETDCMTEDCQQKAHFEILYNCWGTITTHYVCGDHARYHGVRGDGFPSKKR